MISFSTKMGKLRSPYQVSGGAGIRSQSLDPYSNVFSSALGKGSKATREGLGGAALPDFIIPAWHRLWKPHLFIEYLLCPRCCTGTSIILLSFFPSAERQIGFSSCYRWALSLREVKEQTQDRTAVIQLSWVHIQVCLVLNRVLFLPPMLHRARNVLEFSSLWQPLLLLISFVFSLPRSWRHFLYRNFSCDNLTGPRDWTPYFCAASSWLSISPGPVALCSFARRALGLVSFISRGHSSSQDASTSELLCFRALTLFFLSFLLPLSLLPFAHPSSFNAWKFPTLC